MKMPAGHRALRTLDILLESGGEAPQGDAASNGAPKQVITLLRCVVLEQHLDRVLGAIERALPIKLVGRLQFPVIQGEIEVNGRPTVVLRIEAAARLRRLRTRVLDAILPAVVAIDSSPSVDDFLSPMIGPIALEDGGGRSAARSILTIRKIGVYAADGLNPQDRKALRSWIAPLPRGASGHRRRAS